MSNDALILDSARQTLAIEAKALASVADALGEDFVKTVQHLFNSKGRLVVTGMGKSALIGQKIVATLNSTGSPAMFMHAADALHGDLGMISKGDTVLCLSKSGETAELKALALQLRRLGHPIVAMVARRDCFLALQSDFILLTPIEREADPHNLAPTASTAAQLALGDALAMALLALRGFSPQDFAKLHPGGSLGKQLSLTLADLACRNQHPAVGPEALLHEIIVEMTGKRLGATAVVESDGTLAGIITDGDLRRAIGRGPEVLRLSAKQLMTASPRTMHSQELAVKGLGLLQEFAINHVVLVDEHNRYTGMLHLQDLIREGLL